MLGRLDPAAGLGTPSIVLAPLGPLLFATGRFVVDGPAVELGGLFIFTGAATPIIVVESVRLLEVNPVPAIVPLRASGEPLLTSGGCTTNRVVHFGQRMLTPAGGTRRSST